MLTTYESDSTTTAIASTIGCNISPVTIDGGGGGAKPPHGTSPANVEKAKAQIKAAVMQSWRKCFIDLISFEEIA